MNTRSLPRMSGQSTLDIDARRILERAARKTTEVRPTGKAPRQVTWLSDMLTPEANSFGVLRLAMALLVLVSHAVFLTTGKVELEPGYGWTGYTIGQHGVQVFFILSGILVAQSLFKSRSVTDYAIARGLRIFPALAVCVLLTAMVLGPLVSALSAPLYFGETWTAAYIVKTLSLWTGSAELPAVFQNNPVRGAVNTSVWTLKYEVACYAIFALIGAALLRLKAWRTAATVVAGLWLILALAVPSGISASTGERSMLQVLHYFTIFFGTGVLAYAARRWIPMHASLLVPIGAVMWAAVGTRFAVPALALGLGYASIWLATFRFGPLRAWTNRSDYSYAVYLYHYPVAQAVLHFVPGINVVPLIGMTAAIVLPLAFLSWELIERPALELRKRFLRAKPTDIEVPVETSGASAADAIQAATASTGHETGVARTWRPMSTRRTLAVMPEAPLVAGVAVSAPSPKPAAARSDAPASSGLVARAMATRTRSRGPDPVEPTPAAVISSNRMAMVSKRPPLPRPVDDEVSAPPLDPGRAVVVVGDDAPLSRRAVPRPSWQKPMGSTTSA